MMDLDLYLTFVLATSVLMLIPPDVARFPTALLRHAYGLLTVAGTGSAMVAQLR